MSVTSGWLVEIEFASDCRIIVLPVRGAATINPRCPLPTGATRSSTREVMLVGTSSRILSWG